ncbi:hypothetical protein KSS87_015841 [Heliosperma pusillum]|nr:hypothetical protein KSS87_015841 [Heliosperma pusillum]
MGRTPCFDKQGLKKGLWDSEEDQLLINYINEHGHGNWRSLPKNAGLQRCEKSCRLRWTKHLRPGIKRGPFTSEEKNLVMQLKKGPWSPKEDELLINYINEHGHGNWRSLSKNAGLRRCGKSCRLRWTNYLRPDINRSPFTPEEENLVIQLHSILGNRWSAIAIQLPGRTDNDIKNLWNTHLRKRLITMGLYPQTDESTSRARGPLPKPARSPSTHHIAQWESARLEAEARLSRESLIYNPHCSSSSYSDVFLTLWNSEVGESFRKVIKTENTEKSTCQSPVSQITSSTKCASSFGLTQRDEDIEVKEDSKSHIVLLNATSTSSCSDVVNDSSFSELQLLLDFPENNDMSFLENDIYDYFVYPSGLSND